MNQLERTAIIAIISGAYGPISIYLTKTFLWQKILFLIIYIVLLFLGIYRFVRDIRRHKKLKSIFDGIFLFFLIMIGFSIIALIFIEKKNFQKNSEAMKLSKEEVIEDGYIGYPIEAQNFNYFHMNNKIIDIKIGFAGTGFLIGKEISSGQIKGIKEIYGSGVSVIAECSFIGTVDGNMLRLDNGNEYFILENNILRYFNQNKEYQIYNIGNCKIKYNTDNKNN